VVVDPAEEKLRDEFKNTKLLHLPMPAIVRIEEVEKRGPVAIHDTQSDGKIASDTIRLFPLAPPRSGK
jgi:hypothetical protein